MVFKKRKTASIGDDYEEYPESEDLEDEEDMPKKIKRQVMAKPQNEEPQINYEEMLDIVEGHIARALDLLRYAKSLK